MMPGVTNFPEPSTTFTPAGIAVSAPPTLLILPPDMNTTPLSILPPSPSYTVTLRITVETPGYALYVDGNGVGTFSAGFDAGVDDAVFGPSAFEHAIRASGSTRYALRNVFEIAIN